MKHQAIQPEMDEGERATASVLRGERNRGGKAKVVAPGQDVQVNNE